MCTQVEYFVGYLNSNFENLLLVAGRILEITAEWLFVLEHTFQYQKHLTLTRAKFAIAFRTRTNQVSKFTHNKSIIQIVEKY